MQEVNVTYFSAFSGANRLQKLNDFVQDRVTLMPHEMAIATGCSLVEATALLMLLYHLYIADPYLLVFHKSHPFEMILKLPLEGGLPKLPLVCDLCEDEITDPDSLFYDFEFKLKSNVQFRVY